MSDFKRLNDETALLTAATPAAAQSLTYFADHGIAVHRGGTLWRITAKGEATFALERIMDLSPSRRAINAHASPPMGVG